MWNGLARSELSRVCALLCAGRNVLVGTLSAQMGQVGEAIPRCRLMVKGRCSKVVAVLSGFFAADMVPSARWAGQGRLMGKKKKTAHHGRMVPCKVACVCTQYAVWIRTLVSIGPRSLHCTGHEPINCPDWESGWPDGVYRNDVLIRVICTISTRRARIEANRRPGAEEEAASKEKEPH